MKYLWLTFPLFFIGCSSIKFVTMDHGQIVTQDNKPVDIVGNPPLVCYYKNSSQTFSGYFMYQREDGTILLDNFGRGIIELSGNPICKLGLDE